MMRESASVRLTWSFGRDPPRAAPADGHQACGPSASPSPRAPASSPRTRLARAHDAPGPAPRSPPWPRRSPPGRSSRRASSSGTLIPSGTSAASAASPSAISSATSAFKPGFDLASMLPRQGAGPVRIGVDLGAVQRHRAELHHAGLARQQQHLHEQRLDPVQKAPTEHGDGVVVGMVVRRDEAEGHRIVTRTLQLAARKHPRGVAVNQKPQ